MSEEDKQRFLDELKRFKRGDYSIPFDLVEITDPELLAQLRAEAGLTPEVIAQRKRECRESIARYYEEHPEKKPEGWTL